MAKIVDLSQEIYQGMPVFPLHLTTYIFQNITHEESIKKIGFPFATRNLLINEHGPTHCDAVYEYNPDGPTIDQMPLEYFLGPAICLDVSHVPYERYIEIYDLEEALKRHGLTIERGDIVLLYTAHYNRNYGTDKWLTTYSGLSYAAAEWLAQKGVVNIGVDAPAIDHPDDPNYSGHAVCAKYGLTNTENLANLNQVAGKRFLYIGLPLKIRAGTGSPVRAVALVND